MRQAIEQNVRRAIPAVETVLQALEPFELPRRLIVGIIQQELKRVRETREIPEMKAILEEVRTSVRIKQKQKLQPVINGTGILIHTNFGRAPLSESAVEAMCDVAQGYSNLEYDLSTGERGRRAPLLEESLAVACGADAATVVNNCAAALVLMLSRFTRERREVLISRGELVQIGGGFRIPEILEASGARLREVGTTNQTTVEDYENGLSEATGMILKVHRSNFSMHGFVSSPRTEDLASLAARRNVPFIEDIGSGALWDLKIGIDASEITPRGVLRRGVDLVSFSGDKLLGGPQAGIIAGRADLVSPLKREPFFRALRCDKLVLAALEATVSAYLQGTAETDIPVLALSRIPIAQLRDRAEAIAIALQDLPIETSIACAKGEFGGGTFPDTQIESIALAINFENRSAEELAAQLRRNNPPIIGCISNDRFRLDLRTIFPHQDAEVVRAIRSFGQ